MNKLVLVASFIAGFIITIVNMADYNLPAVLDLAFAVLFLWALVEIIKYPKELVEWLYLGRDRK